jgi:hypothetical protein
MHIHFQTFCIEKSNNGSTPKISVPENGPEQIKKADLLIRPKIKMKNGQHFPNSESLNLTGGNENFQPTAPVDLIKTH